MLRRTHLRAARNASLIKQSDGRLSIPSGFSSTGKLRHSHPYRPKKWLTRHVRHGSIGIGGQRARTYFSGADTTQTGEVLPMVQRFMWLGLMGAFVIAG